MKAIFGLVEDHTGRDLLEIAIYNFDLKGRHYDHFFAEGTKIKLKEPFFKRSHSSGSILRVDDPQDIIILSKDEAW